MEILVKRDGTKSYREKVYIRGKPVTRCFARKYDAQAWKGRMVADRDRAIALGVTPSKEIEFEEFMKLWNERREGSLAITTKVRYGGLQRNYLAPYFGGKSISALNREAVEDMAVQLRRDAITPITVDQVLALLKTMLGDAVMWGYARVNPASRFPKTASKVAREHYWTEDEAKMFLAATAGDLLYPVYFMALKSGMRRGELAGLQWSAVNFETNSISVCRIRDRFGVRQTTKTGKKREIPMNAETRRVLGALFRARTNEWVFIRPDGRPFDVQHLYREFRKAQERVGMEKIIHFHDLRHSFASIFLMRGGNIHAGAKVMGHSKVSMTERYGHIAQTHLAQEMEKMCFEPKTTGVSPKLVHESSR